MRGLSCFRGIHRNPMIGTFFPGALPVRLSAPWWRSPVQTSGSVLTFPECGGWEIAWRRRFCQGTELFRPGIEGEYLRPFKNFSKLAEPFLDIVSLELPILHDENPLHHCATNTLKQPVVDDFSKALPALC